MVFYLSESADPQSGNYQVCRTCVMDTSALEITFDADGACNYCSAVRGKIGRTWFPNNAGAKLMQSTLEGVRAEGLAAGRKFDSILGLSGGIDSAVVARRAVDAGLRPLAVHVDGGWNTEASVENVRKIVDRLGLTLETIIIDWAAMRKVQLAFLRSGTLNQDIPQDHAFFVSLYRVAMRRKIPVILSGVNYATESVEPGSWGYSNSDGRHLRSIYSAHGEGPLHPFPVMPFRKFVRLNNRGAFRVVRPLDYGHYDPSDEMPFLRTQLGWRPYGAKHEESLFTHWFQASYLVKRYGIDKRRGHLSSRIISGLTTRNSALEQLESPAATENEIAKLNYAVAEKLELTVQELEDLVLIPHRSNHHYRTAFRDWTSP